MKQMELFDFIEKPGIKRKKPETKLEELFGKIDNPITRCANCLCHRCGNNLEGQIEPEEVEPEEVEHPCFNCDECRYYTGEWLHQGCTQEDCSCLILSGHGAGEVRKRLKVIK